MPDIYRTLIHIAGGNLPEHKIDGYDLRPFLQGAAEQSPRKEYFYFRGNLQAVRVGDWKLRTAGDGVELFHMADDPFERFNRAEQHPEVVKKLRSRMTQMAKEVGTKVAG